MARKRLLSPQWAKHADLYDAEITSGLPLRVAFAALWTVTDRRGIFAWSRNLKPDVLPYDTCDMLAVLEALFVAGFVVKYEVDGKPYGIIPSFKDHQHFHRDEKESSLPAPLEHGAPTVPAPCDNGGATAVDGKSTASNGRLATSGYRLATSDIRLATEEEGRHPSSSADATRLLDGLPTAEMRHGWRAEINVAKQGMHAPPLTDEQIDRACRDYVANGHLTSPSLRHFRGFLRDAARPVKPTVGGGESPFQTPAIRQWAADEDAKQAAALRAKEKARVP